MQLLREPHSVTIHGTVCQGHSHHPALSLLGLSSSSRSPLDSPHHSQPGQVFLVVLAQVFFLVPAQVSPLVPAQVSLGSLRSLIP